ncbi:MAG: DUF6043 family protein [Dysgonamonadaceae bacterium]|jgi:hypothetical protein|nr:DUF6043 family protein [Dysgonamonadaceae bacterium]
MKNPKLKLKQKELLIIASILSIAIAILAGRVAVFSGLSNIVGFFVFVAVLLIAVAIIWSTHIRIYDLIVKRLSEISFFQNRVSWDSDDDAILESTPEQPKQEDKELSLKDMIMTDDDNKQILLTKIDNYIDKGVKGKKIAFMIIALRNLGYLLDVTSDRQLFNAIRQEFDADIGTDKGIYTYLDNKTAKHHQAEIDTLTNYFSLNSFQSNSI